MDRENVIKGIECCECPTEKGFVCECSGCPYYCGSTIKCRVMLKIDTLTLLKEQQERIETLESLRRIEQKGR